MSHNLQSEKSWMQRAFESVSSESRVNLYSLGALGFLNSVLGSEKIEDRKKDLVEFLVKKSKPHFEEAKSHLFSVKQEYSKIYDAVVSVDADLECRGLFGSSSSFGRAAFEVGLAFDTVLNLPFLPGSSIKGATRAAYKAKESNDKDIFGDENNRSNAVFADSYPVEKSGDYEYFLSPDIVNPHYQNDQMDETKVQPTPVIHLTVSPGLRFRFLIAFRKNEQIPGTLKAFAVACHRGLGARTAIGYGKFHLIDVKWDKI